MLGHAIAHEVGHLLLGPEHAPFGIMSTNWHAEEMRAARLSRLGFTNGQVRKVQAAAARRLLTAGARRGKG